MMSPTHLSSLRQSSLGETKFGMRSAMAIFVLAVFVFVATLGTIRANSGQTDLATSARANAVMTALDNRMAAYEEVLYGVRGAFGVDADLDRAEFSRLLSSLDVDDRLPGVQVIGAAHVVERSGLAIWSAAVDEDARRSGLGYPPFEVYPVTDAELTLPINYIEPQAGNLEAFGLDFLSEPNRREASLRARDTGESAASAPVTLVQETATQKAILVYLPLYAGGAAIDTVEQRRAAFTGVVYAAFRMNDLIAGALGAEDASNVAVVDVAADEVLVGDPDYSLLGPAALTTGPADNRVGEFDVSGRTWRVLVNDDGQALSMIERSVPLATLVAGLLVAGLMAALLISMRSARSRAVTLATEMTIELEALTESASEAIISVDETGTIIAWNHAASQVFGGAAEQMIGQHSHVLVPARNREGFDASLAGAIDSAGRGLSRQTVDTVGRRTDGTEFPVEVSMSLWSARGHDYITGFVRDVTERVEAEKRLTETTNMLLGVLGAATEMSIIATEEDGLITVFNAGAERLLGYLADDVVGKETPAVFHDESEVVARAEELGIEPGFDVFVNSARLGMPEKREWTYIRSDGTRVPVELTVTPRHDSAGAVCGFIGVAVDISERLERSEHQQHLLDQEREMVAKLTELDLVKSDFVSTMSHELRTPLTSIIGYAELLSDDLTDTADDPKASMVAMVAKNAQRLLLLVEDLLTLSRIESGELNAAHAPCNLAALLRSTEAAIAPIADSHGVAVNFRASELPPISGNGPEIERVFLNLLTNAVKFSHEGGVVEISADQSLDGSEVVVTVTDHGIGIPEDERQHLFSRFFRARSAEKYAIQGSGLGLSIVANILQRHGGSIAINSTEGVGTTATVRLPALGEEAAALVSKNGAYA